MIAAARRWVTTSCLALLVACGGSGAAVQPGPQSGADLADSSTPGAGRAEDELELQPVSAPEGLVVVGRWKNPGQTADTLMSWSNLPFDWRRLLQARHPELVAAAALDAPVEAAVALDPAGGAGDFPQPFAVVSLGLNSLDRAVEAIRGMGESVPKSGPGAYRIEGQGRIACGMARALGPSPARLVCGPRHQDVDALLPYATRGLPRESLSGGDLHLELRVDPLRKRYGRELSQLRSLALPAAVRQLTLGNPQFDRAVADAVYGLADEGLALLDDLDQLTIDLNATSGAGELDLLVGLEGVVPALFLHVEVSQLAPRRHRVLVDGEDLPEHRTGTTHVAFGLIVLAQGVQGPGVVFLEVLGLAVKLDGVVVLSEASQNLAELQQRVEVPAVPLQDGAEVPQALILATLQNGDQTSGVLFLDLLRLAAGISHAPSLEHQAELAGEPGPQGPPGPAEPGPTEHDG